MKKVIVRSSGGGKNNILWGIILAVLFGLSAVGCALSSDKDDLIMPLFVCAALAVYGFYLFIKGVREARRGKNVPQFDDDISHEFDIDAPDFVKERLNDLMFEGNAATSATVSKTIKRVTYTGPDGVTRTTETVTENSSRNIPTRSRQSGSVTCQACGGINKLRRGQHGVCEYCGSHIEG